MNARPEPSHSQGLRLRSDPQPGDEARVRSLVESTGFFRPDEVEIAVELVRERLSRGLASGYRFVPG
jgi:hypothetical protein